MSRKLFCCRPRLPPAHLFKNDFWEKRGTRGKRVWEKHKKRLHRAAVAVSYKCIRAIKDGQNPRDKMPRK